MSDAAALPYLQSRVAATLLPPPEKFQRQQTQHLEADVARFYLGDPKDWKADGGGRKSADLTNAAAQLTAANQGVPDKVWSDRRS